MFRTTLRLGFVFAITALAVALPDPSIGAQGMNDRIRSEHVQLRVPFEREWLGSDSIMDLERIWRFMNSATGGDLPRRVLVIIDWEGTETRTSFEDGSISVGMGLPAAASDNKAFLLHSSAREMARLGLYLLSRGAADREENRFLMEGMAEILVHEYDRNIRSLGGAWIISQLLDRMNLLGVAQQSAWTTFSGGRHDLRASSPGITFLMTCRELRSRERLLKLFEALRKGTLRESLAAAMRITTPEVEEEWLRRVRNYRSEDVTVTSEADAPRLMQAVPVPEAVKAGASLQVRLFIKDAANDLAASGVFLQDEASGRVLQAQPASERSVSYLAVSIPIEEVRQGGAYGYRVTAVDESGNVRNWKGSYQVAR